MRRSRLSAVVARLIETSWVAALVVVPIFFDPHSARTFDADKILLFRSIALIMFLGLVVWLIEEGPGACMSGGRSLWRAPIVAPLLLLTAAYGVSTIFSIAPRISFWGAYFRCQGTYTWLSYVTIFCAIVLLVRRRTQVDRLVTMALLASFPPAAYGLIQHLGLDPIDWQLSAASQDRIVSTAGNPIFASAFMIMVVPLALARLIAQCSSVFATPVAGERSHRHWRNVCLTVTYLILLAFQLLTIVYAQSRGPAIGLAAGLTVFLMLCIVRYRVRWMTVAVTGGALLGILFLGAFVGSPNRLAQLGRIRAQLGQGTARVRVLIWQGATDLLAAKPLRTIFGYGPDTIALAYEPFYLPELGRYEGRIVIPDRAHNETFDALITTGIVGCAAELLLFLSLFYSILCWLGMAETAALRTALVAAMGLGGIVGGVTPYIVDGSGRFSGVGLPVGIVVGMIAFLTVRIAGDRRARDDREYGLVLVALLAAAVAHFVELQLGIATASTRLYFAVFAGLAVVIGTGLSDGQDAVEPPSPRWPTGSVLVHAAMVGLVLVVLTYEFSVPSLRSAAPGFVLLWLFFGTWVCGGLLLAADSSIANGGPLHWRVNLSRYAFISLGLWGGFSAFHVAWLNWKPAAGDPVAERLRDMTGHVANTVSILYLCVFCIIGFAALLSFRAGGTLATTFTTRSRWLCVLYLGMLIGVVPVVVATNLNGARADSFAKLGSSFEQDGELSAARAAYEEAQRLRPAEETYAISLARVLMAQARVTPGDAPQERTAYLAAALAAVRRAQRDNPRNPLHARNLARVYRLWASQATDPAEQKQYFDQSESYYGEAVREGPRNAELWKEWATLYLEWHQPAQALAKLDESLRLDDDADTRSLHASAEHLVEELKATQ